MQTNQLRCSVKAILAITVAIASLGVFALPASAAGVTQIRGTQFVDDTTRLPECDPSLATYVMTGSLTGCWLTLTFEATFTPSGVLVSSGTERFIGCLNIDERCGTFDTTFIFMAKFDLTTGLEIRGRCQHPIVSGTDGFQYVEGIIHFKDIIDGPVVTADYRGQISFRPPKGDANTNAKASPASTLVGDPAPSC